MDLAQLLAQCVAHAETQDPNKNTVTLYREDGRVIVVLAEIQDYDREYEEIARMSPEEYRAYVASLCIPDDEDFS